MTTDTTFKLDDTTIAGLIQLLALSMGTGTNLMDHFRMMELVPNDEGKLVMTTEFISRTESFAADLEDRLEGALEESEAHAEKKVPNDGTSFGFA